MLSYRSRAEHLRGLLAALPGAGVVHAFQRWAATHAGVIAHFRYTPAGGSPTILGWEIRRGEGEPAIADWRETWELTRYRAVADAAESELLFQDELDAAVRYFRDNPNIETWGSVPHGLRIRSTEARMFGDVLCHVGECTLVLELHHDAL